MTTNLNNVITIDAAAKIAGQTFWVEWPVNHKVNHTDVMAALTNAGFDAKMARSLCNSYVFRRAIRQIVPDALKDLIVMDADVITFQISGRVKAADGVDYVKQAVVTCDKATGKISCNEPTILATTEAAFNAAVGLRTTTDCTRLVERIMKSRITKDVFKAKGTYFANVSALPLIDQIEKFVTAIGGDVIRFDLAEGTATNVVRVQTVVVDAFEAALADAESHIETITMDSRKDVVARAADTLADLENNLRWNALKIGEQLGRLEDYLALAKKKLEDNQVKMAAPFSPETEIHDPTLPPVFPDLGDLDIDAA